MNCLLVERVRFKLTGTPPRLVWGAVLYQRDGLALIYVSKPDEHWTNSLVVAVQNVQEHCYERANTFSFPVEPSDMAEIGAKLQALGQDESSAMIWRMFQQEDDN